VDRPLGLAGAAIAVLAGLGVLAACQDDDSGQRASASREAPASAVNTTNDQDRAYLVAAHEHHMTEIEAGRAALTGAQTDDARADAERFIADHTRLDADVTDVAESLGVDLPDTPTTQQQAEVAGVAAIEDGSFDAAWAAQRTSAHQQERALHQTQLTQGSNTEVDQLASAALPVVDAHLVELTDQQPVPADTGTGLFDFGDDDDEEPAGTPASVGAGFRPVGDDVLPVGPALATGLAVTGALLVAVGGVVVVRARQPREASSPRPRSAQPEHGGD
jgi:putative membrane protein